MTTWVRWVLALVCCMAAPLALAQSRFSLTTQIGHLRIVEGFESIEPCLEAVGRIRPGASAFIEVAEAARDTLTLDELSALCLVGRQVGPGRYAQGPAAPQVPSVSRRPNGGGLATIRSGAATPSRVVNLSIGAFSLVF